MSSLRSPRYWVHGEELTQSEAARKYGIKLTTLRSRMESFGITLEEAIDYNPYRQFEIFGERLTLRQASIKYSVPYSTAHRKYYKEGIPLEKIFGESADDAPLEVMASRGVSEEVAREIGADGVATLILQSIVSGVTVVSDAGGWHATGGCGLYGYDLKRERGGGYTLVSTYLPRGEESGIRRRYSRLGKLMYDFETRPERRKKYEHRHERAYLHGNDHTGAGDGRGGMV